MTFLQNMSKADTNIFMCIGITHYKDVTRYFNRAVIHSYLIFSHKKVATLHTIATMTFLYKTQY